MSDQHHEGKAHRGQGVGAGGLQQARWFPAVRNAGDRAMTA